MLMWVSKKAQERSWREAQLQRKATENLLSLYTEEILRLSTDCKRLRDSLAARLGTSFHEPFPKVERTIPNRRIYTDDGLESVELEED